MTFVDPYIINLVQIIEQFASKSLIRQIINLIRVLLLYNVFSLIWLVICISMSPLLSDFIANGFSHVQLHVHILRNRRRRGIFSHHVVIVYHVEIWDAFLINLQGIRTKAT